MSENTAARPGESAPSGAIRARRRAIAITIGLCAALVGVAAGVLAVGLGGSTPVAASHDAPVVVPAGSSDISLLYTLSAASGTLEPVSGTPDSFDLVLAAADREVIWFSDEPARHAGVLPTAGLATEWADFGFTDSPPNVAISLHDGAPEADTLIVEMGQPTFNEASGTLSSRVTLLDDEARDGASGKNLDSHLDAADSMLPLSFSEVSLFIDDATGPVLNGCLIQPYTVCEGAALSGVALPGVNLTGADLLGANFTGANLAGANFTGANLAGADFTGANLANANLTNANISGATFAGAVTTGVTLPASAASGFCVIAGTSKTIVDGVVAKQFSGIDSTGHGTITLVGPAGQSLNGMFSCEQQAVAGSAPRLTGAWTITISGSVGTVVTPVPGLTLSGVGLNGTISKSATGKPLWSVKSQSQVSYQGIQAAATFSATGIHNWTETISSAGGQFTDADGSAFRSTGGSGTITFAGGAVSGSASISAAGTHKLVSAMTGTWTQSATLNLAFAKTATSTAQATVTATFALTADSGANHLALSGLWNPSNYTLTGTGTVSIRGAIVSVAGSYASAGTPNSFGAVSTAPDWTLSGSAANIPLGDGAAISAGTISASSSAPGFAGTLQVSPFKGSETTLDMAFGYTDATTWSLTATGHSADHSWSPPGMSGLRIDPNSLTGTISSTPARVAWALSAGNVQWNNMATGVSSSGTVSLGTDCPLAPATLCGAASGVFVGFTSAQLTFPSPMGTLPAQIAVLSDGSWMVAQATPATISVTGPAGSTLAVSAATVTVEKGANLASSIAGVEMPDLSASSSGLGISFCGNFAVRIPFVGSNTSTGGCIEWTPDGVAIAQVGISGNYAGGDATATSSTDSVSGVTVGNTTFDGWAWTNLTTHPVATLNGIALTLAKGTSELTGHMGMPSALLTKLGSSGTSIPAVATFSDSSFTLADASFTLDATMPIGPSGSGVTNKAFTLDSITIHLAKTGESLGFKLSVNAWYLVDETKAPVTMSLAAASGSGFTITLTAAGARTLAAPCETSCDGVNTALAHPNAGYVYLSDAFMGVKGAHLWSVTGQLELIKGLPGFGVGATIYQDPTALPTVLHGTTWLKGDFYVEISEVNPCFNFGFTSLDPTTTPPTAPTTYLQVRGGVFKTSTFTLAIAPEGCTVGPLVLPAGATFILDTSLGDKSSIQIMLAMSKDAAGLPTFTAHTSVNNLKLAGIDFLAMTLDISITSTKEVVTFAGNFTLPNGTMTSSFDLTANTDGSIHLDGAVSLKDWKFVGSNFKVQSFNFHLVIDSSSCGTFEADTSGVMSMGSRTKLDFDGSISITCGVLQDLTIDFAYTHNSFTQTFSLKYDAAAHTIVGRLDFEFDHTNSKKFIGHTYHRGSTVKIGLAFYMDTLKPKQDTLELTGSVHGGSINGWVDCLLQASGDDSCRANIHIHIDGVGSWDEQKSW